MCSLPPPLRRLDKCADPNAPALLLGRLFGGNVIGAMTTERYGPALFDHPFIQVQLADPAHS